MPSSHSELAAVDYRALFWQAFDGLCALYAGTADCGLPAKSQVANLQQAAKVWCDRLERQLPEPPDEAGWPTKGPCACGGAS